MLLFLKPLGCHRVATGQDRDRTKNAAGNPNDKFQPVEVYYAVYQKNLPMSESA